MEQVRNITVIPARKKAAGKTKAEEIPKTRVAAYCRVSTDSDEQATSYEAQVEHYTKFISDNPKWELAGIYADDGISGTNTKKRDDFNRMIDDCMNGKIDMVVTKSISRFARNTLDCLKYIRQLKEKEIPVYFEKESINTMDSKGEVLLTIMASLAQQESQSMSQNIRLGIQYRFQQGKMQVNFGKFMGYTRGEDGQAVIVPEEAEVVKRIFREYLEGASLVEICKGLERDGILTGAHKEKWRPETVHKMLRNEKYMGDALLQKTYTTDFLTKKKVVNNGIAPQYYVENSHEAIIPKDIFMRVQEEMDRRANLKSGADKKRRLYSSKYALSGIVFCGHCGDIYRRIRWNNRGCRSTVWRCVSRVLKKTSGIDCPARTVKEEILHEAVASAINQVMVLDDGFFDTFRKSMDAALGGSSELTIREIEEKLTARQRELISLSPDDERYGTVADEIYRLRDDKRQILLDEANVSVTVSSTQISVNVSGVMNIPGFLIFENIYGSSLWSIDITEYAARLKNSMVVRTANRIDHTM